MMCGTYGVITVITAFHQCQSEGKTKIPRVPVAFRTTLCQWVEAAIAGYGNKSKLSFQYVLTEALLMAANAIRGRGIRKAKTSSTGFDYPGRNIQLVWDNQQILKVTNFDDVNRL